MPTDANTLAANSTCIWKCIPDGLKIAALISLFAKAAGVTLDAAGIKNLINEARCINCEIPRGLQVAALISLFANGGVSSTPTPPTPCVNLIPNGAMYDSGGVFELDGITIGATYQVTFGSSDGSIAPVVGGSPPTSFILSPGAGQTLQVVAIQNSLYFYTGTGFGGIPVTATICAV